MTNPDILREIWICQEPPTVENPEDVMNFVVGKSRSFHRMIQIRNAVECIAAAIVFVLFVWLAASTADTFTRSGSVMIAISAAWIAFYLMRYGVAEGVDTSQDLKGYTRALVESYNHQIRLLKSAKYWYLLPAYIGLLTLSAGPLLHHAQRGGVSWADTAYPAIFTVFFIVIWYLNEVVVVGKLRRMRDHVLSMAERNQFVEEEL